MNVSGHVLAVVCVVRGMDIGCRYVLDILCCNAMILFDVYFIFDIGIQDSARNISHAKKRPGHAGLMCSFSSAWALHSRKNPLAGSGYVSSQVVYQPQCLVAGTSPGHIHMTCRAACQIAKQYYLHPGARAMQVYGVHEAHTRCL